MCVGFIYIRVPYIQYVHVHVPHVQYAIIGEQEQANLVVRMARFFYIYLWTFAQHTVIFLNVFT